MSLRILTQSFIRQRVFTPAFAARFYGTKKFTSSHEWIDVEDGVGTIGLTDYAQKSLGDVVFVELPEVDTEVEAEESVGAVESVKAASEIYSPVAGTIVGINEGLLEKPNTINKSPETDGWLFKIKLSDASEIDKLLDEAAYKSLIESEGH
ncbi:glycine cleavage system H-protein subunit [Spiromyces aspiralis]|uniref:Glycine cleavage system H-protein subunit n=1 Tax=Spiromyces aspiralis TaxID=68401 RepID=A0ACC1HPJ8_9FUNG|nr:glycine cleavage system H-protein subunit [Spiromyces aspiralis]